jgi:hypothetical protein
MLLLEFLKVGRINIVNSPFEDTKLNPLEHINQFIPVNKLHLRRAFSERLLDRSITKT